MIFMDPSFNNTRIYVEYDNKKWLYVESRNYKQLSVKFVGTEKRQSTYLRIRAH